MNIIKQSYDDSSRTDTMITEQQRMQKRLNKKNKPVLASISSISFNQSRIIKTSSETTATIATATTISLPADGLVEYQSFDHHRQLQQPGLSNQPEPDVEDRDEVDDAEEEEEDEGYNDEETNSSSTNSSVINGGSSSESNTNNGDSVAAASDPDPNLSSDRSLSSFSGLNIVDRNKDNIIAPESNVDIDQQYPNQHLSHYHHYHHNHHHLLHEHHHHHLVHYHFHPILNSSNSILINNYLINNCATNEMNNNNNNNNSNNNNNNILIKANNGSIRGKRNNVRNAINNYIKMVESMNNTANNIQRNYLEEENNKCILYVTSLAVIRKTLSNSKALESILENNFIQFELRDVYINDQFRRELLERLNGKLIIPAMFLDGKFLGSFNEIEKLNESGELMKLLNRFRRSICKQTFGECSSSLMDAKQKALSIENNDNHNSHHHNNNNNINDSNDVGDDDAKNSDRIAKKFFPLLIPEHCSHCGNKRFINCTRCYGSGKCIVHHFPGCSVSLKCTQCDRSGLIRCPNCANES